MLYPDGTVNMADDFCARGRCSIRVEYTVNTEIAIVRPFSVVTAIGIGAIGLPHRMVYHFPDTSAHKIVILVNHLPVFLHGTGADAHSVGIFAEEIRPVIQLLLAASVLTHLLHLFYRRIHLAANIIGYPFAVDGTFIMNGQICALFQPVIHHIGIMIATSFVTQTPHDHTGAVLIPAIQPNCPVKIPVLPLRIMGNGVISRRKLLGEGSVSL